MLRWWQLWQEMMSWFYWLIVQYLWATWAEIISRQWSSKRCLGPCPQSPQTLPTWTSHVSEFSFSFFKNYFIYLICACVCTRAKQAHTHITTHVWNSEENLREPVLSFHHVGPRDWNQIIWLCGKHLYLLIHLTILPSLLVLTLFLSPWGQWYPLFGTVKGKWRHAHRRAATYALLFLLCIVLWNYCKSALDH